MVSMGMSPSTARTLWGKQMRQVAALNKADESRALLLKKHLKEEEKRQELLLQMMQKELDFVARKGAEEEVKREERLLKAKMFEKKLTAVRVRKHYGDYCMRMKSRMVNKSAREEQIFIKQFEKGEQRIQFVEVNTEPDAFPPPYILCFFNVTSESIESYVSNQSTFKSHISPRLKVAEGTDVTIEERGKTETRGKGTKIQK
eukprot:sb/3470635/